MEGTIRSTSNACFGYARRNAAVRMPSHHLPTGWKITHEQRFSRCAEAAPHAIFARPQPLGLQRGTAVPDPGRHQAQPVVVQLAELARPGARSEEHTSELQPQLRNT